MKTLNLVFATLILLAGCKSQPDKNKKQDVDTGKSQKEIVKKEKVYDTKCAILYMPDSIQLATLEKEKSQEEFSPILKKSSQVPDSLTNEGACGILIRSSTRTGDDHAPEERGFGKKIL